MYSNCEQVSKLLVLTVLSWTANRQQVGSFCSSAREPEGHTNVP